MSSPSPNVERDRLEALHATGMLDTPPEERFDRITRLAAQFFDVPICLVSLIDEDRLWFKSRYGLAERQTARSDAFCAHAVEKRELIEVEDAQLDPRFVHNVLVTGAPLIRFYAGQPVFGVDGHALGTLCIIDSKPRQLTVAQIAALRDFALLVQEEFTKAAVAEYALLRSKALLASEAKFQATFEQAAVGIAHVGLDGALLHVNRKFGEIVGYPEGALRQLTFQDLTHPDDLPIDMQLLNETLAGARQWYSIEKRYIHRQGHFVWINLTVALRRDEHGAPDYFISVIEDIGQKKHSELALHRLNDELESRVAARTAELETSLAELGCEVAQRISVAASLRRSEEHNHTILEASHDAFIGIDSNGIVNNWNRAAELMFGWSADEAMGIDLAATIIPPEYHQAHGAGLKRFLQTGQGDNVNQRLELLALTKRGVVIPVEMTISAYKVNDQVFFSAFLHDITERRDAAAALEQKQTLLDAVLDAVDVGVLACDAQGELTLFNRAAAQFHGLAPGAAGTTAWAAVARNIYRADGSTPLAREELPLYRALAGESVANAEITIVREGEAARFLFASGQRLLSSSGQSMGAVVAVKDVTALKNAETLRATNESRLRGITENLPSLIGHIDKDERFLFLNGHALRFYGKTADELIGKEVRTLYGAAEYGAVKPYIDQAKAGAKASFESQMVVGGKVRHFSAVYIPETGGEPGARGFYAMAMDITARKNSEITQAESEERLRTITDNLPVLIAYIDSDEVYRFANATHAKWYGIAPQDMLGKSVMAVFGAERYAAVKPYLTRLMAGEATQYEATDASAAPVRTSLLAGIPHLKDGRVVGAYLMTTDISAAKQYEAQLQLLARSDPLTGLPNRRSYEERLREAALRGVRSGRALALMFLDIDYFKQINDTLGHAGGDEVLREFAHRLRAAVRSTDTVCRLAGDEFTIILEGVLELSEAIPVAEKILAAVRAPFYAEGSFRTVTASIGLSCQGADEIDTAALARDADAALYLAKAAGRNRYAIAPVA
ncbi:PAS domain S-box protein [Massilia sp. TSP1-1-2]|uniref:PAS domain S-box protein n=1 Tax=Massilia sp. TSP1-1-2 TaxID=2804649 RepID=UPI003CF81741